MSETMTKRTELLTQSYADEIEGEISSWDRLVIKGHLQPLTFAQGMTSYLYRNGIRIFDYTQFTSPLRDSLRTHVQALAAENGLDIEFIRKSRKFRKEDRIDAIVKEWGDHAGLVHIFSAIERCLSYYPWHNKESGKTYVKAKESRCLHYYFYFIDEELGLC